ncbi:hypothetical protein KUCAC02_018395 [Chaenocephalus aceratus]|uniref:Uncharacterized protein n=1 Tax=Chaenocephalus aceratus TaxID=36190 RepID=A0ACB9W8N7_CHAAC|nr:hypothetical protein KUCAC02_018395 [Chaenocephalus aceratus]
MDKARTAITQHRGDPSNRRHPLGFFEIQFGLFHRQTFRWVAENYLGYAAYLVAAMKRDLTGGCKDSKEHALNKGCFKECFIGAHSPAQWPNCNRVVEARFKMVIRAYKHIRECVITNAKVMTETTIQLPEVNVATITLHLPPMDLLSNSITLTGQDEGKGPIVKDLSDALAQATGVPQTSQKLIFKGKSLKDCGGESVQATE